MVGNFLNFFEKFERKARYNTILYFIIMSNGPFPQQQLEHMQINLVIQWYISCTSLLAINLKKHWQIRLNVE